LYAEKKKFSEETIDSDFDRHLNENESLKEGMSEAEKVENAIQLLISKENFQ